MSVKGNLCSSIELGSVDLGTPLAAGSARCN